MNGLRCEIATDFRKLEDLADKWDSIWNSAASQEIFNRFEWARSVWPVYGPKRTLCTPLVFHGTCLVGILPLSVENGVLQFLGSPRSDYNDILCADGQDSSILEIALKTLLEDRSRKVFWNHALLEGVPEQSQLAALLGGLSKTIKARLHFVAERECLSASLSPDKKNEPLKSLRTSKTLRRNENFLRREGNLSFRRLDDRKEIKTHLPEFFRQHELRWAFAGRKSQFLDEDERRFYRRLVDSYDPAKELHFSVLQHAGRPIAYHLGFIYRGKFLYYKPTFDIGYWKYSPGDLLHKYLYEYVTELDVKVFDYTVGGERYKKRYANQTRQNYTLHIFPRTPAGIARKYLFQLKVQLMRCPKAFRCIKGLLQWVASKYRNCLDAIRKEGFVGSGKKVVDTLLRTAVYRSDCTVVSSLATRQLVVSREGFDLRRGKLEDLATLALRFPETFSSEVLTTMRRRLQGGDIAYISMWERGAPPILLWLSKQEEISSQNSCLRLNRESIVITDCWIAPSFRMRDVYLDALQSLLSSVGQDSFDIWLLSDIDNKAFQQAIDQAGFRGRYRLVSSQFAHWFTWSRIEEVETA